MTVNFSTRFKKSWILDVTSDDATYWSIKYIGKVTLEKTTRGFPTLNSKTLRQNFSKNFMIATPRNLVPSDARTLRTTRTQCSYMEIFFVFIYPQDWAKKTSPSLHSAIRVRLWRSRRTDRRSLLDSTIGPLNPCGSFLCFMLFFFFFTSFTCNNWFPSELVISVSNNGLTREQRHSESRHRDLVTHMC